MSPKRKTAFLCSVCCILLSGCLSRPASSEKIAVPSEAVPSAPAFIDLSTSPPVFSPDPALQNETAQEMPYDPVSQEEPDQEIPADSFPQEEPVQESSADPVSIPKIQDAWYAERTEEMRRYMRMYGDYPTEEDLEAALSRMEIDPDRPMIALTFDDGPMAGITDEIVDILAQYDARATFFIIGSRFAYDATPDLLRKILGHGNAIGNHMYNHDRMDKTDYKTLLRSAKRLNDKIYETTGYTCHLIRPPGGYGAYTAGKLGERYDMSVILWAQSGNVHERDPEKINENVHRQIVNGKELEDGDIVLLHDTKPWMVEAVRLMVPQLIEEGYQLVTVPELLHFSDRGFVYGEIYKKKN